MIDLREGEKIRDIKRRHIVVLISELFPLVIVFIMMIVAAVVSVVVPFSWPEIITDLAPQLLDIKTNLIALYLLMITILLIWQVMFIVFTNYYLDCWIITNERTINTELKNLFSRNTSSVPHDKIQDISVDIKGIFPTIFKYGNLQIQTAGGFKQFIFKQIPNPHQTKEDIFKAQKGL